MSGDLNRFEKQKEYPLSQIYFYLTDGCNLRCRHCWLAPGFETAGRKYPMLPVEFFESVIREARPLGLTTVKLTGGEPLLHPQFLELLNIIRREELSLSIETNGLLCSRQIAEEIARSPDCFVSVSLDGADEETHEWVRGVEGSFKRTQQAVRYLTEAGITTQIIMSLLNGNAHQVDAVVEMAEGLGASAVKFNIVMPIARGKTLQETAATLDTAEIIQLGRYVEMELAPKTGLQLDFDYPSAFRPLSRMATPSGCDTCAILDIIGVIATGHYALCGIGKHIPELVFGRVGEDRLEEIWRKNPTLVALRSGLPQRLRGICSDCLMKHLCLGACIAQNYYRTGSLWEPFWFCAEAVKEGLFPETRLGKITA